MENTPDIFVYKYKSRTLLTIFTKTKTCIGKNCEWHMLTIENGELFITKIYYDPWLYTTENPLLRVTVR